MKDKETTQTVGLPLAQWLITEVDRRQEAPVYKRKACSKKYLGLISLGAITCLTQHGEML